MRDLQTQLTTYQRALTADLPDPVSELDEIIATSNRGIHQLSGGDRSGRRVWTQPAAVTVAGVVIVGAVSLGVWFLGNYRAPSSSSGPTVISSTVSTNLKPGEWVRVADPLAAFTASTLVESRPSEPNGYEFGTSGIWVTGLVDAPEGVVAVGVEAVGFRSLAAVWISYDQGSSWTRVPHDDAVFGDLTHPLGGIFPSGLGMAAVAYSGGRFVAFGSDTTVGVAPVAWYSDDGLNWVRVPAEDGPQPGSGYTSVRGLVAAGPRFVAVGADSRVGVTAATYASLVWTSPDGTTWQTHNEAIASDADPTVASAAVLSDGLIVAGGQDTQPRAAAAWFSTDGVTWSPAEVVDTTGATTPASILDIAVTPTGAVAIGYALASPNDSSDIAVWTTSDGHVWTRVPPPDAFMRASTSAIAWGPGGLVAIADASVDEPVSVELMLTSLDGVAWEATPIALGGDIRDIGFIDGRYVGVGAAPAPIEQDPDFPIWDGAVWVSSVVTSVATSTTLPVPLVVTPPTEGPVFGETTGIVILFDDGIDGLTAFDPDRRLVGRSAVVGQRAGDEPYSMIRVGDRLVVGWGEPHAVDIDSRQAMSLGTATIFVPSVEPNVVWLIDSGPRVGSQTEVVWQVDVVSGLPLQEAVTLDAGGVPLIGIRGGLALQTDSGLRLWIMDTAETIELEADGTGFTHDVFGDELVWCGDPCTRLAVTNTSTLETRFFEPPAGFDRFLHASRFSPDGRYLAALVNHEGSYSGEGIWILDLDTLATTVVSDPNSQVDYLVWSPDSGQLFASSVSYGESLTAVWRYDLTDQELAAVVLPFGGALSPVVIDSSRAFAYFGASSVDPSECPAPTVQPSRRTGICTFGM